MSTNEVALKASDAKSHDPSACDYAGTSPFEWGGEEDQLLRPSTSSVCSPSSGSR